MQKQNLQKPQKSSTSQNSTSMHFSLNFVSCICQCCLSFSVKHAKEFWKRKVVLQPWEMMVKNDYFQSAVLKDTLNYLNSNKKVKANNQTENAYPEWLSFGMLVNQTPFWFKILICEGVSFTSCKRQLESGLYCSIAKSKSHTSKVCNPMRKFLFGLAHQVNHAILRQLSAQPMKRRESHSIANKNGCKMS